MSTVIVMAGGQATRWSARTPAGRIAFDKLDAPIDGQPLIERTVAMLAAYRCIPLFSSANPAHAARWPGRIIAPIADNICASVLATRPCWSGTTRILLGDVVWSDEALRTVLCWRGREVAFFGKSGPNRFTEKPWGELYAAGIPPEDSGRLADALRAAVAGCGDRAKLWDAYHMLIGRWPVSSDGARSPIAIADAQLVEIDDWTDDIDTPSDYAAVDRAMRAARAERGRAPMIDSHS